MVINDNYKIVHWYDGMLISANHIQQFYNNISEQISSTYKFFNSYNYSVNSIKYDAESIKGGSIRILELDCIMPDGTIIKYDARDNYKIEFNIDKNITEDLIKIF